ncbi:hypothetical protein [Brevundimonas sp.]|uniref:hypothetical protein n=1 Tax=Brevundimonas sp. TaxID=1871086 RepID=UPI00261D5E8B|nr:hypothetical protein [Brevundimonas sp.]
MKLSELCTIQMGFTARARLDPATDGGRLAIQLRDITLDGEITLATLARVDLSDVSDRYDVGNGDVVFRSRGERTIAIAIDDAIHERAIAILPLMILRPNPSRITSDFLAWSINLPTSQRHLDQAAQGGSLRMVPKSALEDLRLDVPDLTTQRQITAAAKLAKREAALAASLVENNLSLTTLALADIAKRRSNTRPYERSKP